MVHPDGKSHTGIVVMWVDIAVLVHSKKQQIGTEDSTEAELVGITDMLDKVVHVYYI